MVEMYEVKITKYALEQLREIDEYIINVLMSIEEKMDYYNNKGKEFLKILEEHKIHNV